MIKFLIEIAVVHALFYYIWNFVFTLPIAGLTTLLKIDDWVMNLPKGLGAIVIASISSLIVIEHSTSIGTLIFYAIIAGVLLLFNLIQGSTQARQNARQEINNVERMRMEGELKNDYIFWLIALGTFILTLFVPIIGTNPINRLFIFIMDWVLDIRILNSIIIGFSILVLISSVWKGFFGLKMLIAMSRNYKNEE